VVMSMCRRGCLAVVMVMVMVMVMVVVMVMVMVVVTVIVLPGLAHGLASPSGNYFLKVEISTLFCPT
jgi:hypothetical protein